MSNFKTGNIYFSIGLNMRCEKVVLKTALVRFLSEKEIEEKNNRYNCVTFSHGMKTFDHTDSLFETRKEAKESLGFV